MTIKMKALRSFGTKKANEGHVRRGREFDVLSDGRAKELEAAGFAHRIETKAELALQNKMEPPPLNKAAEVGPLGSVGGATGEETRQPLSLQGLPPPKLRGRPPLRRLDRTQES